MEMEARFTANRFTVTPEARAQIQDLATRGTIRVADDAGITLYHIDADFGLGIIGHQVGQMKPAMRDVMIGELVETLVAHLQGLTREQALEADWVSDDDFTDLATQVRDLYLWIQLGYADQEIREVG